MTTDSSILDIPEDEPASLSFQEIYEQLLISEELILTIAAEQEGALRKGLASVKHKQNKKFAEQNLPIDNATLQFQVTPNTSIEGAVNVQITLAKKASIQILGIHLPDNEI